MHAGGYVESRLEEGRKNSEINAVADSLLIELKRMQARGKFKPTHEASVLMEKLDRALNKL